jgi:hypothetical protein
MAADQNKPQVNNFHKGMDKDTAYAKHDNLRYQHAENLRILTDKGQTSGAMINVDGNEYMFKLPCIVRLTRFDTDELRPGAGTNSNGDFSYPYHNSFIAGRGDIVITNEDDTTVTYDNDLTWPIHNSAQNQPNDSNFLAENFGAAGAALAFVQDAGYKNEIKAEVLGGSTYFGDRKELVLFHKDGLDIEMTGNVPGFNVYNLCDYKIIGSTNLRDDIILFTTEDETKFGGEGQIWRISYNKSTLEPKVELVFAGPLNFSTQHLIEAVARYETNKIIRVYWTDNFNSVRNLNIVDPKRWGLDLNVIQLKPSVTIIPARCTSIGDVGSGRLDRGTYQVSYRLQTPNGLVTEIAPWSIPISINAPSEALEYWDYGRSDKTDREQVANKSISYTIDSINEGFAYLEIFLLKRGTSQGILYKVDTVPLTAALTEDITFTVTGEEGQFSEIFVDALDNFNANFTTAKTIAIRDNRLLVGNVKTVDSLLDFDAGIKRYDKGGNTYSGTVNPSNKDSTKGGLGNALFRWKAPAGGTVFGDTDGDKKLGGHGKNVAFEFITYNTTLDAGYSTNYSSGLPVDGTIDYDRSDGWPVVDPKKDLSNLTLNGITYNMGNLWNNHCNPYFENMMKGYQRDETYRFGILFYDTFSKPLTVQWIGDIRMPAHYDSDDINDYFTYGLGEYDNNGENLKINGTQLGVKFTVDITTIRDKISGFSIVRAPRPNKDKTVIAQGLAGDVFYYTQNPYFIQRYTWNGGPASSAESYEDMFGGSNLDVYGIPPEDLGYGGNARARDSKNGVTTDQSFYTWFSTFFSGPARRGNGASGLYHKYNWDNWLGGISGAISPGWINSNMSPTRFTTYYSSTSDGFQSNNRWSTEVRESCWFTSPQLENGTGDASTYGKLIGEDGLAGIIANGASLKPLYVPQYGVPLWLEYDWYNRGDTDVDAQNNMAEHPHDFFFRNFRSPDTAKYGGASNGNPLWRYILHAQTPVWPDPNWITANETNAAMDVDYLIYNYYHEPHYVYNEFTGGASSSNDKFFKMPIQGGKIPDQHIDNFLMDTSSDVGELSYINDYIYQNVETFTRNNWGSDMSILRLGRTYCDYHRIYNQFPSGFFAWNGGGAGNGTVDARRAGLYTDQETRPREMIWNVYRELPAQYGGADELDVVNTDYISTGHYQKVDETTASIVECDVWGGDTMVQLHSKVMTYPCERMDTSPRGIYMRGWYDGEGQSAASGDTVGDYNMSQIQSAEQYTNRLENLIGKRSFQAINIPLESTINTQMTFEKGFNSFVGEGELELRDTDGKYTTYTRSQMDSAPFARSYWPFSVKDEFLVNQRWDLTYNNASSLPDLANYAREDFSKIFEGFDPNAIVSSEFDNRIYASDNKINGEQNDSWVTFKILNKLDVDGHHGPINKLEVFNDHVLFFQDTGFGTVSINPRSLIQTPGGEGLLLGSGKVLDDFKYLSTEVGSKHQWPIIKSKTGVYFFDANSRKFYRTRGKVEPLSDVKGMSSWFYNNLNGAILSNDNTYIGAGIISAFDPRYNEVVFTFKDGDEANVELELAELLFYLTAQNESAVPLLIGNNTAILAELYAGSEVYLEVSPDNYIELNILNIATGPIQLPQMGNNPPQIVYLPFIAVDKSSLALIISDLNADTLNGEAFSSNRYKIKTVRKEIENIRTNTLAFSESIDAFSSFYDFAPDIYIGDDARYFSPDPNAPRFVYVHNEGEKCVWYTAEEPSPSIIRFIVNPKGYNPKIFNNIEYLTQLVDSTGADIVNETFHEYTISNEYQDETRTLIPWGTDLTSKDEMHIRRRMRNWRFQIPRSGAENARIRNPYVTMSFTYNNNDNKEITINDIISYYTDVPM